MNDWITKDPSQGAIYVQAAIRDALLGVCAETGGTRCRHVPLLEGYTATDFTHGRVLGDGENCSLLTDQEREEIAKRVMEAVQDLPVHRAVIMADGLARASRQSLASGKEYGRQRQHSLSGRYDGSA